MNTIEAFEQDIKLQENFIKKFKPELGKDGGIYIEKRRIIPESRIKELLKTETETKSAPLGIRSLQDYTRLYYIGITRKHITDFLR